MLFAPGIEIWCFSVFGIQRDLLLRFPVIEGMGFVWVFGPTLTLFFISFLKRSSPHTHVVNNYGSERVPSPLGMR